MRANSDACPVGTGDGIWARVAVFDECADEFMYQVGVRAAVAAALDEREMLGIVNFLRHGELANGRGEKVG